MEEITIKVDIPSKLKNELGLILAKAAEEFAKKTEKEQYKKFNEIVSESKLSKENALKLGKELNKSLHLRYKKLYPKLK